MSNYISSFLIEPVIRQARRFSRPHDDGDSAPSTSQLQHVPAEEETIHAGGRLAVSTAHGVRAVQDVLSASAWPQIIPGQPVALSPSSEDGGLEAELANLRDGGQRTSSPSNSQRHSTRHSLTDILRGNAVGVDDDMSDNPLYGIPDRFRSTTTSFSSLNSLNDAAMTPTEGHTRSRANTGRGSYSYSSRMGDGSLPADDGMGLMRRRIKDIQELNTSNAEKARLIHGLMTEQYSSSQPSLHAAPFHRANSPASLLSQDRPFTPTSDHSMNDSGLFASPPTSLSSVTVADNPYNLTPDDLIPTYMPKPVPPVPGTAAEKAQFSASDPEEEERPPSLGCKHYKRNVKLQCSTCSRWYTCRFCHDEAEDHSLKRRETKNMLCMLCGCAQPAGEECIDCGEQTARYYCNVCKLWDDASEKSIYHCNDCGICRVGQGLGKDFYHCKTCCVCMSITIRDTHRCIERSTDCDCPICGDYMFTSPQTVVFMRCGHSIHHRCYYEHMKSSYRCPICSRSIVNMEMQFRQLDRTIEAQPMPPQFRDTTAWVYCNDCCAKTSVRYHWLGLKCGVCDSYNTAQICIRSGPVPHSLPPHVVLEPSPVDPDPNPPSDSARPLSRGRLALGGVGPTGRATSAVDGVRYAPYQLAQRAVRSVSPARSAGVDVRARAYGDGDGDGGESMDTDDEGEEVGFWGGERRRGVGGAGGGVGEAGEEEEDDEVMEDEEEEEEGEDEDEEDYMQVYGHR